MDADLNEKTMKLEQEYPEMPTGSKGSIITILSPNEVEIHDLTYDLKRRARATVNHEAIRVNAEDLKEAFYDIYEASGAVMLESFELQIDSQKLETVIEVTDLLCDRTVVPNMISCYQNMTIGFSYQNQN